ncbi:hypothetical protein RF11_02799 [Thelohanellus kitauei]|uniref:Uncharacterized protein n=1 Tax=Thelohanellus kitauei TaxID=669202 RepID=A0A0C2IWZ9_THEKT|nr:hypothetical protein RF11_02799 [Thelohanellus kitauei]
MAFYFKIFVVGILLADFGSISSLPTGPFQRYSPLIQSNIFIFITVLGSKSVSEDTSSRKPALSTGVDYQSQSLPTQRQSQNEKGTLLNAREDTHQADDSPENSGEL